MLSVLSSIRSGFWRQGPKSPETGRPGVISVNTLAGLPVELLLSITDFLFPDDWVCISLCSRRLFDIFFHRTKSVRQSIETKLCLLRRLERDLPNYYICYISYILREFDGTECFGSSRSVSGCFSPHSTLLIQKSCPALYVPNWGEDRDLVLRKQEPIWCHVYYRILFLYLQHAIRYSRPETQSEIYRFPSSYIRVQTHPSNPEITSLLSIEALDHPEGVCLRIQQVRFVHRGKWELLFPRHDPECQRKPPQKLFLCIHISDLKYDILFDAIVDAYFHGEPAPNSTFTCEKCNTDAEIELCKKGSHLGLVVTTWINLAPGSNPDDPRQKVYCNSLDSLEATDAHNVNWQAYNPQVFFEQTSLFKLKALKSRNIGYLNNKIYQKVMREVLPTELWFLHKENLGNYWFNTRFGDNVLGPSFLDDEPSSTEWLPMYPLSLWLAG